MFCSFGIRVCLVCLSAFAPACFTVLCLSTLFALCPAGWLRLLGCLHVPVACAAAAALSVFFRSALCLVPVYVLVTWVELGFPWPHSPLAFQELFLGTVRSTVRSAQHVHAEFAFLLLS